MDQFNTYEAKKNFSSLLSRVQQGETIIIAHHNQPVAELRPVAKRPTRPRPFGLCAGEFSVPDDFNAPLPDEVLDSFYR